MINLIVEAMQKAIYAVTHDEDLDFAFHWGEAGGIAAVAGVFGVKALEMCDDISDAYEDVDLDFMKYILREASERLDNGDEHYARTRDNMLHALEFGAALQEAMKARDNGDPVRNALMIGFTAGLMFRYDDPGDGVEGTVRDKIIEGYHTDSDELLRQAHGTLGFGARMSDPMSFMGKAEAARYYEERVRTMRWVQNFGLREARSVDETVAIPNALSINYQLIQQAGEADETQIGDEVEYEEIEFLNEEDLMPVDDCEDTGEEEGTREAAAYVRSGTDKAEQGDYDGAIADYDRAIAIAPDAVGPYVNRAISRDNVGDYEGAIADWTRALELNPGDAGWYVNRGMVRETIGDYDGALADYSRSTELEPNYEVAYIARAHIKGKQGDYEGAIIDYDRVVELWPDSAPGYSDRGFAKLQIGDYQGAIADFDRAIELEPNNASAYSNRGLAKSRREDHDGAVADYNRAIELDPK